MFLKRKDLIEEGDLVLIWIARNNIKPVTIVKDECLQTKFGQFKFSDMIGKKFGSQISSNSGRGFVHLMAPTPELWALSLPHRTQIVYSPDASYIIHRLQIRPNSRVLESGTGSGAFTHALARVIGNTGQIYTYEYHLDRFEQAVSEFASHNLPRVVTTHRNVCEDGFKINVDLNVSSVFLDLPAPWLAIPKLFEPNILDRSKSVTICCFSPCIEQVSKTAEVLKQFGFNGIEMVENQAKRWEGHYEMRRTVDQALNVLRDVRRRRDMGIERRKRKRKVQEIAEADRTDEEQRLMRGEFDNPDVYNPWGKGSRIKEGDNGYEWTPVGRIEQEIKSHTSYLTFAQLPPLL